MTTIDPARIGQYAPPLDPMMEAAEAELAFNPNQPRHPEGHPQGGQWKSTGSVGRSIAEPDGGFTVTASTLTPITSGYAVALGGSDKLIVASDGFKDGKPTAALKRLVIDRIDAAVATEVPPGTRRALGGWHNPADSKIEVNVTAVFDDRDAALRFARDQDQIAMADLAAIAAGDWGNAIIDTGGTGGDRGVDEDLPLAASADIVALYETLDGMSITKRQVAEPTRSEHYEIRHEHWRMFPSEEPTEMHQAYTPSGDYIGPPELAKSLVKRGITQFERRTPESTVVSIGFDPEKGRWHGWSHRAIASFEVGDKVAAGDILDGPLPVGFEAKTLDDAKKMAWHFADEVS
jgi:hypothetical protein